MATLMVFDPPFTEKSDAYHSMSIFFSFLAKVTPPVMVSCADALMLPILVSYFDERQLAINLAIYSLRGFLFNGLMRPNTP